MPLTTQQARAILAARQRQQGLPPLPTSGRSNRIAIPDDWRGIRVEIGRMRAMVLEGVGDPLVIKLARAIVRACPSRDRVCELRAIFDTVRGNMRFIEDPIGREAIQTPRRMATLLAKGLAAKARGTVPGDQAVLEGDCDEHATLTTSLAGACGYNVAFGFGGSGQTAKVGGRRVPTFHHVWGMAGHKNVWVALDTTGEKELGETWTFPQRGVLQIA